MTSDLLTKVFFWVRRSQPASLSLPHLQDWRQADRLTLWQHRYAAQQAALNAESSVIVPAVRDTHAQRVMPNDSASAPRRSQTTVKLVSDAQQIT